MRRAGVAAVLRGYVDGADYGKCILCYKCVEACGEEAQFTFPLGGAGRGFSAYIATGFNLPLAESPREHPVMRGFVCVKGRFGYDFVNRR